MSVNSPNRPPAVFNLDDPTLKAEPPPEAPLLTEPRDWPSAGGAASRSWSGLFWSAAVGLFTLWVTIWAHDAVLSLLNREGWLGWTAAILFSIAALALFMIVANEILGLLRLSAIAAMRKRAEAALASEDKGEARAIASAMVTMLKGRPQLAEAAERLKRHQRGILDARQALTLTERELLLPLDRLARTAIGTSGRRVSVVTSLSPAAFIPVAFVAYENFRMLRRLAGIYGGRPGLFAILRLVRMIAGHLALTGGIAFTDDLLQQVIGHGLTARLSRRLGEGVLNGVFTIRIGIAAVEVLRPLPYIEARRPRLREFVSEFLKFGQRGAAAPAP
jgi:putative membrane protein